MRRFRPRPSVARRYVELYLRLLARAARPVARMKLLFVLVTASLFTHFLVVYGEYVLADPWQQRQALAPKDRPIEIRRNAVHMTPEEFAKQLQAAMEAMKLIEKLKDEPPPPPPEEKPLEKKPDEPKKGEEVKRHVILSEAEKKETPKKNAPPKGGPTDNAVGVTKKPEDPELTAVLEKDTKEKPKEKPIPEKVGDEAPKAPAPEKPFVAEKKPEPPPKVEPPKPVAMAAPDAKDPKSTVDPKTKLVFKQPESLKKPDLPPAPPPKAKPPEPPKPPKAPTPPKPVAPPPPGGGGVPEQKPAPPAPKPPAPPEPAPQVVVKAPPKPLPPPPAPLPAPRKQVIGPGQAPPPAPSPPGPPQPPAPKPAPPQPAPTPVTKPSPVASVGIVPKPTPPVPHGDPNKPMGPGEGPAAQDLKNVKDRDAAIKKILEREKDEYTLFELEGGAASKDANVPGLFIANTDEAEWRDIVRHFDLLPLAYPDTKDYWVLVDLVHRSLQKVRIGEQAVADLQARYASNGILFAKRQLWALPVFADAASRVASTYGIPQAEVNLVIVAPPQVMAYLAWKSLRTVKEAGLDVKKVKSCNARFSRDAEGGWVLRVTSMDLVDGTRRRVAP